MGSATVMVRVILQADLGCSFFQRASASGAVVEKLHVFNSNVSPEQRSTL